MTISSQLITAASQLRDAVNSLTFSPPVTHVYNPLDYAWEAHKLYLTKYGDCPKEGASPSKPWRRKVVMLGMNPGPWGMAQTGIPFGEIPAVRDWIGIEAEIAKPDNEHPKRPVDGFSCGRSEVSGRRLWGFFAERFGDPESFFAEHYVANYCPLVFMEESGRNRTPDKLPAAERKPLDAACDAHLLGLLRVLRPQWAVGVGGYAQAKLASAAAQLAEPPQLGKLLHPSPASPAANRGWGEAALKQLRQQGIWK